MNIKRSVTTSSGSAALSRDVADLSGDCLGCVGCEGLCYALFEALTVPASVLGRDRTY